LTEIPSTLTVSADKVIAASFYFMFFIFLKQITAARYITPPIHCPDMSTSHSHPFLLSHSYSTLRVAPGAPGRPEAFLGDDASRRELRQAQVLLVFIVEVVVLELVACCVGEMPCVGFMPGDWCQLPWAEAGAGRRCFTSWRHSHGGSWRRQGWGLLESP
jgi:hypothetical protein